MAKSKYVVIAGSTGSGWASSVYEFDAESRILKAPVAGVYFSLKSGTKVMEHQGLSFDSKEDALESAIAQMLTFGKIEEPGKLQEAHELFVRNLFETKDPLPIYFERQYETLMEELHG